MHTLYLKNEQKKHFDAAVEKITDLSQFKLSENFHTRIDRLREFINAKTDHNINAEFYKNWRDDNAMAQNLIDYVEKKRHDPAPFECASRSGLMASILRKAHYKTRMISLYDSDDNLAGHAFLEIFNPETKSWEAQDPDYNIYWKNKTTGQRASIIDVAADIENYRPCNGKYCSWAFESDEHIKAVKLHDLIKLVSVIDRDADQRYTVFKPGVEPDKIYRKDDKKGSFCQLVAKNCRDGFFAVKNTSDYIPVVNSKKPL